MIEFSKVYLLLSKAFIHLHISFHSLAITESFHFNENMTFKMLLLFTRHRHSV